MPLFGRRRKTRNTNSRTRNINVLKSSRISANSSRGNSKTGQTKSKIPNIFWKIAAVLVVIFVIFLLIISMISFTRISSWVPSEGWRASNLENWKNEDNLTLLLLGIDDTRENLYFVDFIQLQYYQPGQLGLNIITIDPDLAVTVPLQTGSRGEFESVRTNTYTYRQLLNYYYVQSSLLGGESNKEDRLRSAFTNLIYELENDLGMRVNRFLGIKKSDTEKFADVFGTTYFNFRIPSQLESNFELPAWLSSEDQIALLTEPVDTELRQHKSEKLSSISQTYASSVSGLSFVFNAGLLILNDELNDIFQFTNLNGVEMQQIYFQLRGLSRFNIRAFTTAPSDTYVSGEYKFLDRVKFAEKIKRVFSNTDVSIEQARIDVINGSGRPGLAGKTRRVLSSYNFRVVRIDNSEEIFYRNTLFVTNPDVYQATIVQLKLMYPDLEILQRNFTGRPTGDMVLVVI